MKQMFKSKCSKCSKAPPAVPSAPVPTWIRILETQVAGTGIVTPASSTSPHLTDVLKPCTLCSSSSPGAVTTHRHFCSWKARAGDVFEWETLDVSSPPCCSRRVCSLFICSSLDAQFPNDGIFISTVSWLHPAATKCFLVCDFSLVHSHKKRVMCSVGVSGSWGLKVLFYTTCNAKHISDSSREIRPSFPSALLQKFKNYRTFKIGKVL